MVSLHGVWSAMGGGGGGRDIRDGAVFEDIVGVLRKQCDQGQQTTLSRFHRCYIQHNDEDPVLHLFPLDVIFRPLFAKRSDALAACGEFTIWFDLTKYLYMYVGPCKTRLSH